MGWQTQINLFNALSYFKCTNSRSYKYCANTREYCTCSWTNFSSIGSILVSITTILTSIVKILASIVTILVSFKAILKRKICNFHFESQWHNPKLWKSSKLLEKSQVVCQYLRVLRLQVNTFFKYWLNTRRYYHNPCEYCHNTYKYWAGEYTVKLISRKKKS